jgi:4-hydroxy-tetrahydrodipicolinate reductase
MSEPIELAILGVAGRMGAELTSALARPEYGSRFRLVSAPKRGENLDSVLNAEVIIEFSAPEAALALAEKVATAGKRIPIVMGSTGWTADQNRRLEGLANQVPILRASNFSVGVAMAQTALSLWSKWPGVERWIIALREVHHTRKKDAPSGTALTLAGAIREHLPREIPIDSVREGDVVGIHEVTFESPAEKLTLIHEAKNRAVFAEGALEAARHWVEKSRAKKFPARLLSLIDLYAD